jgi:rhomboid family GlyGly-CTERM serine protease
MAAWRSERTWPLAPLPVSIVLLTLPFMTEGLRMTSTIKAGRRVLAEALSKNAARLLTLRVALVAIMFAIVPGLSEVMQYDRSAIAAGQWWRLVTGHFSHWSCDHLFWDLLMFLTVGVIISNWRVWLSAVIGSLAAISLVLWTRFPDLLTYRGLSGIDTALFTVVVLGLLRSAWMRRDWAMAAIASACAVGLAAKLAYESITGHCLFVDDSQAGFVPVVAAHVTGAMVGLAVFAGQVTLVRRGAADRVPPSALLLQDASAKG